MHIPDGYLSAPVWAALDVVSGGTVALAARKVSSDLEERKVPLMALIAALVFAAQMLNFPVAPGVSGHLLGSVLVVALLGVAPGILVVTTVLVVQAVLFADGGLLALGANVFNMGVVGCLLGGIGSVIPSRKNSRIGFLLTGVAAWLSVVVSATLAAVELGLSGHFDLRVILPPMVGFHALIGLGEAFITVAALKFLRQPHEALATERTIESPSGEES
jgi:cobalt/nickel transport system permease protein